MAETTYTFKDDSLEVLIEESFHTVELQQDVLEVSIDDNNAEGSIIGDSITVLINEEHLSVEFVEDTLVVDLTECVQWGEPPVCPECPGSGTGGKVFVTDISGAGIVSDKNYVPNTVPANAVILNGTTDNDSVTIHFIAEGGPTYSPIVDVGGTVCTNMQQFDNDRRLFYGSVTLNIMETTAIEVVSSTGDSAEVEVIKAAGGPEILSMVFVGGYPGLQTEVKENDTFDIAVTFAQGSSEPVALRLLEFGACKADEFNIAGQLIDNTVTVTGRIKYTGTVPTERPCKADARNSFGTYGNELESGNTILCSDRKPTFVDGGTEYPPGQAAFKDEEVGIQTTTVNYATSVLYSSPDGTLFIPDGNLYEPDKLIQCANPGVYNDSVTNFRIVATRVENGTTATFSKNIEIADVPPTLTISQPYSRLRSGVTGAEYSISMNSNQNLMGAFELNIPIAGSWSQSLTGGPKYFARKMKIYDHESKGSGQWTFSTIPTNRAGIPAIIVGTQVCGGFTTRTITVPAFGTVVDLNVEVVYTSKLIMSWSFKSPMNFVSIGSAPPVVSGWTINATGINPAEIIILDIQAAAASSQQSTITIQEAV